MTDKTMNIKYIQDYSQVVHVTPTPSIFISIKQGGARACVEVVTKYGECEWVPCEMDGEKRVCECNDTSCNKFFIIFYPLKYTGMKMSIGVVRNT